TERYGHSRPPYARARPAVQSPGPPPFRPRPRRSRTERNPGERETDQRLGVDQRAGRDEARHLVEADPLDGHVLRLDSLCERRTRLQVERHEHEGVLVAEPGRVVELGQPLQPPGPHSDLLLPLAPGAELDRLT